MDTGFELVAQLVKDPTPSTWGVSSVGLVDYFPLGGGTSFSSVLVAGKSTGTTESTSSFVM